MDTRKFRSDNANDDDETKTMLGEKQKQALFDWAAKVRFYSLSPLAVHAN
jgi:hypothetical protein